MVLSGWFLFKPSSWPGRNPLLLNIAVWKSRFNLFWLSYLQATLEMKFKTPDSNKEEPASYRLTCQQL